MSTFAELLGNAKRQDLYRLAKNEDVPNRGRKKYHTQMTNKEKSLLFSKLKSINKWGISRHALDRIEEKNIRVTHEDVVSTIHNAEIIEYHLAKFKKENDERVLLCSKDVVNGKYKLKVVYSITTKRIVSVWLNHILDNHKTIDMKDYNKDLKIT